MSDYSRRYRPVLAALALLAGTLFASATAAANSSGDRLDVTLVNGAGPNGEPVAAQLRSILKDSDSVSYTDAEDLLAAGASHGVTVETLRKGSLRETHVGAFRETLRDAEVDAILVLDVFSGTAQVVAIGPRGRERSDTRRPLSGRSLSDDDAASLLKAPLEEVAAVWKKWRKKQRESSEPETAERSTSESRNEAEVETDTDDATDSGTSESGVAAARTDSREVSTDIRPKLDLHAGAIAGRRELVLSASDSEYGIRQVNPFVGAKFGLRSIIGTFDQQTAAVGVDVFGIFAPIQLDVGGRNSGSRDGGGSKLSGSVSQLGLDLAYLKQLGDHFRVDFGTGFEVLSFRVEKNPSYTGNRYAQFRFTGGVNWWPNSWFSLRGGLGLAPLLESDVSGGAFGDSAFAPALLGEAGLDIDLFDPVSVSLNYKLYHYDLTFRSPKILRSQASVRDTYHLGSLEVSYRF
jgi:hypothetical protein